MLCTCMTDKLPCHLHTAFILTEILNL
jgi:hypothetical protein